MPLKDRPKRVGGRPSKEDAEALPGLILDAAWDLFCEQGYNGASVDAVAARANVSKRTLYDRFGPKEALFEATFTRASVLWQDEVLKRLDQEKPDWLGHFTSTMLEMAGRRDALVLTNIFSLESPTQSWAARAEDVTAERALAAFAQRLAQRLPDFPDGPRGRLITRGLLSLLVGWATIFTRTEPRVSRPQLQKHIAGEVSALLSHHGCL